MAKTYIILSEVYSNPKIKNTKKQIGKFYQFTLPNGIPFKVNKTYYDAIYGGIENVQIA